MAERNCSIPDILGFRNWFVNQFDDICAEHDARYVERRYKDSPVLDALDKIGVDLIAIAKICRRNPVGGTASMILIVGLFLPITLLVSIWYWYTD